MECANCGEPATLACSSCKNAAKLEGDKPIVHYRGAVCQRQHWNTHKPLCRKLQDRDKLVRIVATADKLFYIYRELTFSHLDIKDVQRGEGLLTLRGEVYRNAHWPVEYREFPSELFTSETERKIGLGFLGCRDAIQWMNEILTGLMGDLITQLSVIVHRPKNNKLRTRVYSVGADIRTTIASSGDVIHEVLQVQLRAGGAFIVDLTGVLYGYDQLVTPAAIYMNTRSTNNFNCVAADPPRRIVNVDDYSMSAMLANLRRMQEGHNELVNLATLQSMCGYTMELQAKSGVSLKSLWKLPQDQYLAKRDNLVDFVERKLHGPPVPRYFTVYGRLLRQQVRGRWNFPH